MKIYTNNRNAGPRRRSRVKICAATFFLLILVLFITGGVIEMQRIHINTQSFTESSKQLENPNRGFYHIFSFVITDEYVDYYDLVQDYYTWNSETSLVLAEINLCQYRAGEISREGLQNIDSLLYALAESGGGRQLIVRFLYDVEGKNLLYEPEDLDIILGHMEQLGEILRRHASSIFTLQGLFVGNWGEMHHTRYDSDEDLRTLAGTLARAVGKDVRLSVRTPAQWRMITQQGEDAGLAAQLGLFNDGIMGSESDLGTYDMDSQGPERRTREQELAFQEELCASVPNGGEVVADNPYNDFENAVRDLAAMHITYLNEDYDQAVLDKWAHSTVYGGVFDGMDGLTYIERHLGYRLLIDRVTADRRFFQQEVEIAVDFRNVGFAPLYHTPETVLVMRSEDFTKSYPIEHNLRTLGGEDVETARAVLPLAGLHAGSYSLYLSLVDPESGKAILLANGQEPEESGYFLGTIEVRY